MASWDLTELSRLLQGMQNDLEVLKREHLDKFTTIKYQKGLAAAATDFVDATLDPHQEVKNIGRCVSADRLNIQSGTIVLTPLVHAVYSSEDLFRSFSC